MECYIVLYSAMKYRCRKKLIQYNKQFNNIIFIVESRFYIGLLILSILSNIKTSYWINHWSQLLLPQSLFTFISLPYTVYDKNQLFYNILSKNPINFFTINDEIKLKSYYLNKKIFIILTDLNINENKL